MNNIPYYCFRIWPKLCFKWYTFWNKLFFGLIGIEYGKHLRVGNKVYVLGHGTVKIGDSFTFLSGDSINPICRNIRGSIFVPRNESRIIIGDRVGISSACLWAHESITIGNDVNIGGDCLIMDNDAHPHDFMKRRAAYEKIVGRQAYHNDIPSSPIVIEDDVWIGARCQILKGVHIGARSIIAAGSVVTKDIPSDVIAGGNPCRVIRMQNVFENSNFISTND